MAQEFDEVAPPGWEGTVKKMKKHKEIDNPWALAWWMKNRGAKSHVPEPKGKKNESFTQYVEMRDLQEKQWIQGAVDPEHQGYCTPITKKTCTPRRKALAMRFKKGDLHKED